MAARAAAAAVGTLVALAGDAGAHGAMPGRVATGDLVRHAAYGTGAYAAGGPGLAVALGDEAALGLGPPGCVEGWSHRPLEGPRAALRVTVPEEARRLSLWVRPVHERREITVRLGDRELGSQALGAGWQRLTVAVPEGLRGRELLLRLRIPGTGEELAGEAPAVDDGTRALLHAVRFARSGEAGVAAADDPLGEHRVLWLRAGEVRRLPVPWRAGGRALETRGVVHRGDGADLRVAVESVAPQGHATTLATLPGRLDIPWNVDLTGLGQAMRALQLRAEGDAEGAVGLVTPRITEPAPDDAEPAEDDATTRLDERDVVVVAIGGLRADDVAAVDVELPGVTRLDRVWTSTTRLQAALASLWTGRYPVAHGIRGRDDALRDEARTLAEAFGEAGFDTHLHTGFAPAGAEAPIWRGFGEVVRAAESGAHIPHAEPVLEALASALRGHGEGRVLAAAYLGDPLPPLMPRGEAWTTYWDGGEPPWKPARTRQVRTERGTEALRRKPRSRRFLRALRRGKVEETLQALRSFLEKLDERRETMPLVAIVGLGSRPGGLPAEAVSPETARVPVWIAGLEPLRGARTTDADLTDVASMLTAAVDDARLPDAQGLDPRRRAAHAWPTAAYLDGGDGGDLAVSGDVAAWHSPQEGSTRRWYRADDGWQRIDEDDPPEGAVGWDLLRRRLRGWRGAGAGWREPDHTPAARHGGRPGHATACER